LLVHYALTFLGAEQTECRIGFIEKLRVIRCPLSVSWLLSPARRTQLPALRSPLVRSPLPVGGHSFGLFSANPCSNGNLETETRKQGTGNREREARDRKQEAGAGSRETGSEIKQRRSELTNWPLTY